MNLYLTDQHVVITGGSKGIGLACAAVFLASSRASYVTGAVLAMDGALTPIVA